MSATLAYVPVVGDIDGDGADELIWYAPGSGADFRWEGLPSSKSTTSLTINGDYLPRSGDLDGDGQADIAWYGPGGRTDWMWWGRSGGGINSGPMIKA